MFSFSDSLKLSLVVVCAAAVMPVCAKGKSEDGNKNGRAGNWTSSAQGAPSVEACRKAVAAKPDDAIAHNDLGWALRQNGDAKAGAEELKKAVSLDAKMPQAHTNLSVCLLDLKKPDEAVEAARKAVDLDQSQPVYHVNLGNALAAKGDNAGAISEYKLAIAQKADYENAHYNLGRVLLATGDDTAAKKSLAEALRLDPEDGRVLQILDKLVK